MVKGISKRVVVVRFPDTRVFEQAIFIVREDATATGISADQVLREACQVADGYVRRGRAPRRGSFPAALLYAGAGAGVMGLAWLLTMLL